MSQPRKPNTRNVTANTAVPSTSRKRPASKTKPDTQPPSTTPDALAATLSSTLNISDKASKGKRKATPPPLDPEERCLVAMRAVNASSKQLSCFVSAGWKPTSDQAKKKGEQCLRNVKAIAEESRSNLGLLRDMGRNELDIERAASSVVGKLLSLELYELALLCLSDMHDPLVRLYLPDFEPPSPRPPAYFMNLPLLIPTESIPSEIVLSLIPTYFAHSTIAFSLVHVMPSPPKGILALETMAAAVHGDHEHNLLAWLPLLSSDPSRTKSVDSVCTKVYAVVNKLCSHLQSSSLTRASAGSNLPAATPPSSSGPLDPLFQFRMFSLTCLAHTSPGTVESEAFWGEAGKVIAECKANNADGHRRNVLSSLNRIITVVQARPDNDAYLSHDGKRFRDVLDGWLALAKAANDISTLDRISNLVSGGTSPTLPPQTSLAGPPTTPSQFKADSAEATRLYTLLSRAETIFSQEPGKAASSDSSHSNQERLETGIRVISETTPYLLLSAEQAGDGRPSEPLAEKVYRAFERLRRVCVKIVEAGSSASLAEDRDSPTWYATSALQHIVEVLESAALQDTARSSGSHILVLTLLDTLFVLSKTKLIMSNSVTYGTAFDWLERGWKVLNRTSVETQSHANHLRILSGAFYNLAGSLYRATRYAVATRFLDRSCTIGAKALETHRQRHGGVADIAPQEKEREAWVALEESLHKRWEVLGVCHSRTGDRKLAYQAFLEGIKSFPFSSPPFVDVLRKTPGSLVFTSFPATSDNTPAGPTALSAAVCQLGVLVDRVTYMGTCELFLEPQEVSLKSHFDIDNDVMRLFVGALLERQIQSLEPSRYKPTIQKAIATMLADALDIYSLEGLAPIRRAGFWLKWLEGAYFGTVQGFKVTPQAVGEEVLGLLARDVEDLALDAPLAHFRYHYQATLHVWLALHIHKSGNNAQFPQIKYHAEEVCRILRIMLQGIGSPGSKMPHGPRVKFVSPKQIVAPTKKPMGGSTTKVRTTTLRARAAKVATADPVTPKPKRTQTNDVLGQTSSPKPVTPPTMAFDDFSKLSGLLQVLSQLLGLLGQVVTKVHLLGATRRLCERYISTRPEDFIQVSLDLGHEYTMLGKTERAANLFASARHCINNSAITGELQILYYLRYAELLGTIGDVPKGSSAYCEAAALLGKLEAADDKGLSTIQRVNSKVTSFERIAVAATSFATIQYSKDDPTTSLNGLLQALRLYHRAIDLFARLAPPPPKPAGSDNPFDMSDLKDALPSVTSPSQQAPAVDQPPAKTYQQKSTLTALEWRIASGLLSNLFALAQTYMHRGSAREAEYFILQASDLAESLNASAMVCRSLTRMAELKLCLGKVDEAHECLRKATRLVEAGVGGVEAADLRRLKGELSSKMEMDTEQEQARTSYEEAMKMLEDMDEVLTAHDNSILDLRKSLSGARSSLSPQRDSLMPALFVRVLRQNIALLHQEGEEYQAMLDRLRALPSNAEVKAGESSLLAKLTLEDAYARFRADMFLSSLAESTITLPMGMTGEPLAVSSASQEILGTLSAAEKLFWSDLALVARRGKVSHVRDAVVSLAVIKAFQTSLGKSRKEGPTLTARLLDSSAQITLRREMLEIIQHKFQDPLQQNDLQCPLITVNGSVVQPRPKAKTHPRGIRPRSGSVGSLPDTDDEPDATEPVSTRTYWDFIASRYRSQLYDPATLCKAETTLLPHHWTVVSITLTSDQTSLFVTRQRREQEPLIFCIPLKGRRETDEDEDADARQIAEGGQMGYTEVIQELDDVIRLSDEGTRGAVNVDKNDKHARAKWWKERSDLDKRMKVLLENIEFCWLGAFKTILSEPASLPPAILTSFRSRLENIFVPTLLPSAPAPPQPKPRHKKAKSSASSKNSARLGVTLSDTLLETFANLPSTAPAEELEDLAYFILDLYAFHGGPNTGVVISEIDMDQLVVDLRSALEEVGASKRKHLNELGKAMDEDHHTFLVLDKNVQAIPWENIPILLGKSVSRIPSMEFLIDRILWARHQRGLPLDVDSIDSSDSETTQDQEFEDTRTNPDTQNEDTTLLIDRAIVDPKNTYVILNPSGDLKNTEGRFIEWLSRMQKGAGWEAIVGRAPSENEMAYALGKKDLMIYFGHGGAEQYMRSHKIRHLDRCAATMLWGCSSGILKEMGEFDRVGTPWNYIVAGCPTLIANLWDVTDRDIDKFSLSVFEKMRLAEVDDVRSWKEDLVAAPPREVERKRTSIVRAVAESRDVCKLKYLTGAAPVVYGIPFYM